MLCDDCLKNTATIHMTTFVNGQVKTTHLCAQCAAKRNKPAVVPGFSFNDLLSAFYENEKTEEIACGMCGMTLSSFQKTGKLGCAQCYKTFEPSILPVLKGIHMNEKHTGKRPGQKVTIDVEKESKLESRKRELKGELKAAISAENFEEAARLRDEIALLEKEGSKNA
jgi:protein arginine kinase activator